MIDEGGETIKLAAERCWLLPLLCCCVVARASSGRARDDFELDASITD